MKQKLLKLTFVTSALLLAQMSFGQLVNVPLSNAVGGTPHYTTGIRNLPGYAIDDPFAYNPDTPTSPYPDDNASGSTSYFLPQADAAQNYWGCDVAIPSGKSLKYLDFYVRNGVMGNSGLWDRCRELQVTLSDGVTSEDYFWEGATTDITTDADPINYARMDFVAQGFSAAMLQNATSIRIDHASAGSANFLEFMELRLAADDTTLSVDDLETSKMVASPNPLQAGNQLKISLDNKVASNNLVQVYSIIGKEVYTTNANGNEILIDYSVFPSAGLYMIKIGTSVSKIIVK